MPTLPPRHVPPSPSSAPRHVPPRTETEQAKARYSARWRAYARHFLLRHPLCKTCEDAGRTEPATQVDHITPCRSSESPGFWDVTNHQALCRPCHGRKTRREGKDGSGQAIPSRPGTSEDVKLVKNAGGRGGATSTADRTKTV